MTIELTINGRTKVFESGKEAAEWMDRMRKPNNKHRKRRRKNKRPNEKAKK